MQYIIGLGNPGSRYKGSRHNVGFEVVDAVASRLRLVLREGKGINLSTQEKQKWEERILMLSEKIRPLSEEIQELKLQNRLKKRKIGYGAR